MNYPYKQIAGKSWKTWTKNSTGWGKKKYPESCAESTETKLLIRLPEYSEAPFLVTCDQNNYGGGWTVLMRRTDGSEDFYRDWKDYKRGFGQLDNEFFLGPKKSNNFTPESIGSNDGDAGYSLGAHVGMQFSTKDRKNDIDTNKSCAVSYKGAWCALTGVYGDSSYGQGVFWHSWRGYNYSYKRAVMMIRPTAYSFK
ncbi:ryncolin-1-like [Drosophila suzukii]|uniref:Ryncolin-1-like n=1 Tax=Drosophila suzukii TaxID=28584 RepID=A0ABM4TQD7_DROSZ